MLLHPPSPLTLTPNPVPWAQDPDAFCAAAEEEQVQLRARLTAATARLRQVYEPTTIAHSLLQSRGPLYALLACDLVCTCEPCHMRSVPCVYCHIHLAGASHDYSLAGCSEVSR